MSRERAARIEAATECLAECCRAAADANVTVLLQPLNRYESDYPNRLDQGLEIVAAVGATNLKLLADTFHMNIEEQSIDDALLRAAPYLGHVHLVDSNRRAPGDGHLDMESILHTLVEIGFQEYLSFEVLPLPNADQAAQCALSRIRRLLERN